METISFYCSSEISILSVAYSIAGKWNHLSPQRQKTPETMEITELGYSLQVMLYG